jgi:hypothetical protein
MPGLESFSQSIPIRIGIGNETTSIPYTVFFPAPVHPVVQLGTEFAYQDTTHSYLYQTANVGYIYHKYLYQGIYLGTELGYDYRFHFGLNLKALFGLAFLHAFAVQDEYQFENGEYALQQDWGNARLMPSLTLGLGYRLHPAVKASPEIFLLYQSWVEYPYSPGFIPLMTHTNLMLGMKLYISHPVKKRHEN